MTANISQILTSELAWHYRIAQNTSANGHIGLYIDRQKVNDGVKDELEILFGETIELYPVDSEEAERMLTAKYLTGAKKSSNEAKSISGVDFVRELIDQAQSLKSSDIHIETYDANCRVRFRIDGKLVEVLTIRKDEYPTLINKVKIMAGLDISEKRLPQDGRINYKRESFKVDIRVSVLPTLYGEKIVLRILGSSASHLHIDQIGLSDLDLSRYKESIRKPNGIILISGPTGSGKTTTLYATLKVLNKTTDNILTIEDPIEYTLEGVNQVQAREDIGLTFSKVLRSFLRQDPDVIMVGEMRDGETASLAIRAALTGHLVLSTIHTNSAWGTISRLVDMGVPPFLIASTLNTTVAQRLVRTLCKHCKQSQAVQPSRVPADLMAHQPEKEYIPVGCAECHYTGYNGRQAIYEVIPVDQTVGEMITQSTKDGSQYFKSLKIKTLRDGAWEVFRRGETSLEEVYPLLLNDQY